MGSRVDLKGKTLGELEELFSAWGKERFRARQIYRWIYGKLETGFPEMTDLSKPFRRELEEHFLVSRFDHDVVRVSRDGTVKFLFMLPDGDGVETVLIPEGRRNTICLSTQVGCRMGCRFCAAAEGGFSRNLTAGEIVNQFCAAEQYLRARGERSTNVVFMGMGEPLDNLDEVLRTIEILNSEFAFSISQKRITVSTCGLIPELKRLVSACDVSLAVSLNATTDALRSKLMAVNKRYPLQDLVQFLEQVKPKKNRKVTVEYLLIAGLNDSPRDAARLAALLKSCRVKVNLLPFNQTGSNSYATPGFASVDRFREILVNEGIQTIIRERRGADIEAACGQLRGKMRGKGKTLE
ncbi:MAG: 23S rRNA (adenine(2503)-C(2))-methyltransferase RlmN [Deltaproteobacteria bacterium]|nr:23S rRNA (adenine(2503)-C(2))-methyltransferase RlmN [Deltaproteobacteria bacterium]NIS76451.1 23S rRNA (adenine(2503)-C(2))-methyltransferase RlmN [Deltaproteobacteria bacterium]